MATGTTATQLSVDRPAEGARLQSTESITIEGWAWSPGAEPTVSVTVGDSDAVVRTGGCRPDVGSALGIDEHCGFDATVPLRRMPSGPAEVVVTATDADVE